MSCVPSTVMIAVYLVLSFVIFILSLYIYLFVTRGLCKSSAHLINKVVIVTGANTGIGFETAKNFAERGARLIVACRNEQRGTEAVLKIIKATRNQDVYYRQIDLSSFESIRQFANGILETEKRLDILVNNAGVITGSREKTEDGLPLMVQVNYLGPFLLTKLLLPLLQSSAPSRIINLTSGTHRFVNVNPESLKDVCRRINPMSNNICYFRTKLCINLMTVELARRTKNSGVTVNCVHPGVVNTNIIDDVDLRLVKFFLYCVSPLMKKPWEGAQTTIYLAVTPELETATGGYYVDCKLSKASGQARNPELAKQLWDVSEHLIDSLSSSNRA